MRTLTLLAMLLLAAACGSKDNSATNQVSMLDFAFSPESLNVSPGDTVTWVNNGAYDHTTDSGEVGSPDGNWDSGIVAPGARFSHVFTNAGDFHYYCALHAASYGMKGVVSVH